MNTPTDHPALTDRQKAAAIVYQKAIRRRTPDRLAAEQALIRALKDAEPSVLASAARVAGCDVHTLYRLRRKHEGDRR